MIIITIALLVTNASVFIAGMMVGTWRTDRYWRVECARQQGLLAAAATTVPDEVTIELDGAAFSAVRYDAARRALILTRAGGAQFILPYPYGHSSLRTWPSCAPIDMSSSHQHMAELETQLLRIGLPGATSAFGLVQYLCDEDTGGPRLRFVDSSDNVVSTGYRTTERRQEG